MRHKLLICDFDGTLANTRKAVLLCMHDTLGDLLGPAGNLDVADIEQVVATGAALPRTFELLLAKLGASSPERVDDAIGNYRARYARDSARRTTLYPGVRRCLDAVRANGMRTAVVSNKGEAALRAALGNLGILDHFDLVLGEQADLPPKPAPDLFERRIRPFFELADNTSALFVGDTPADLAFANNARIDSCWATYGHGDPAACRALHPRFEIDDFHQLRTLLG